MSKIAVALVLLLVAVTQTAGASPGRTAPSLRLVERHPMIVRGVNFHPAERVTVRSGDVVRVVRTSAAGEFSAGLGEILAERCTLEVVARGAHRDRARLTVLAMCQPQ